MCAHRPEAIPVLFVAVHPVRNRDGLAPIDRIGRARQREILGQPQGSRIVLGGEFAELVHLATGPGMTGPMPGAGVGAGDVPNRVEHTLPRICPA